MRLSTQQRIIAWRLALQPIVLRSDLVAALWGQDDGGGPIDPDKNIDVRILQLRRLLPVEIVTRWGFGYVVPEAQRPLLLDALSEEIERSVINRTLTISQHFGEAA